MPGCLYYPYSRPRTDETIKRALLLFDDISFLDSQPDFVRRALSRRELRGDVIEADAVDAAIAYGVREGVVKLIDTARVISEYSSVITAATVADVGDDRFAATALRGGSGSWSILSERLPQGFLNAFYPGAGTFLESISLQEIAGGFHTSNQTRGFAAMRWRDIDPEAAWKLLSRRGYRFVVGGNPHIQLPTYEVPFLPASSLRINEALLVAAAKGCIPFTDSEVHDRLLRVKAINAHGEQFKTECASFSELASEHVNQSALSWRVLNEFVTSEQLAQHSLEDVLRYRAKNHALLSRLRRSLSILSEELASSANLRKSEIALENLVSRKILAEVEKAQQDVASNWQDFVDTTMIRAGRTMIPAVAVSVFGGLDLIGIVLAAAAAGAAGLGGKGLEDAIALLKANRKSKRHDFSYLTNFYNR